MESVGLMPLQADFWAGKRVLVTGHTGFKGGWLCHWLQALGAQVSGFALAPPTTPSLFEVTGLSRQIASTLGDIRDREALSTCIARVQPELILHLAAQPLVRQSYRDPAETYSTNVMGVVNLLDAVRDCASVRAVLNVTTDKCYENLERREPYRETDALGGYDPYSSSKACAELVTAAYRRSFLSEAGVAIASARAGNVIGGGDWASDRLVPDMLRAFAQGDTLHLRYPGAIRPWQHVLEPLSGYLALAEKLLTEGAAFAEAWNFGPNPDDEKTVGEIALTASRRWRDGDSSEEAPKITVDTAPQPHEAGTLKLDSTKARSRLGWRTRWTIDDALARTLAWHHAWRRGDDMRTFTLQQINDYQNPSRS
jgi:CDP-glucose 4,6-dehydratase